MTKNEDIVYPLVFTYTAAQALEGIGRMLAQARRMKLDFLDERGDYDPYWEALIDAYENAEEALAALKDAKTIADTRRHDLGL